MGRISEKVIYSRFAGRFVNFPPVAYVIRTIFNKSFKVDSIAVSAQDITSERIARANLQSTLDSIVIDVVDTLNYVGAMVATYEPGGALPVRAWHAKPETATREQVQSWEAQASRLSPNRPISLTDLTIARVYVDEDEYADNLSVKAYHARHPVTSSELFDLFQPIAPESTKPFIRVVQDELGVQEVVAVPFFIETTIGDQTVPEFVGNLFALKGSPISDSDQKTLQAFGRQAAAAILSDRRRSYVEAILALIFDIQTHFQDEAQILQRIVEGVVQNLDYVGAMVATYEPGGALPVQAWYAKPEIATREQVLEWEAQVARLSPNRPISLTDPTIARVYVDEDEYADNLSLKAYHAGHPVTSSELFDLFQPVAPESTKPFIRVIQDALGVRQVIAVPFFKEAAAGDQAAPEFVGNLFVLSRAHRFSSAELRVLRAFGQQAATGIRNAQLYRQAENRRQAAEIFGKMAFNASASVHDLRNKIGVVRGYLQFLNMLDQYEDISEPIFRNLEQMADTLDTLHEPFQQVPDTLINVNSCIRRVVRRVREGYEFMIDMQLSDEVPEIYAAQDMLVEAFKVLIKNAAEAVSEKGVAGRIVITSGMKTPNMIKIDIEDNGIGIKPEHRSKIFEMRWSTKDAGLGFGLFWMKDYIEGLGGSVAVQSTYSEGTAFTIMLPAQTHRDQDA